MSHVTLTLADNGTSTEVQPNATITINLEANPTTGYRWAIDNLDQKIVTLVGDTYAPAGSAGGGGGTRTFTLRAIKTGTVHVRLKLWREWQGDTSIIQRFDGTIQVR